MTDNNPSIINHISVPVSSISRAKAFYDAVMPVLGAKVVYTHGDMALAYGKMFPEFWLHPPADGQPAATGNGWHVALSAASAAEVDAFYAAALQAGGTGDGAPGARPNYGPAYYGCFVLDPDGNKIEATFWDQSKA